METKLLVVLQRCRCLSIGQMTYYFTLGSSLHLRKYLFLLLTKKIYDLTLRLQPLVTRKKIVYLTIIDEHPDYAPMIRLDIVNKTIIREWAISGMIALIPSIRNYNKLFTDF